MDTRFSKFTTRVTVSDRLATFGTTMYGISDEALSHDEANVAVNVSAGRQLGLPEGFVEEILELNDQLNYGKVGKDGQLLTLTREFSPSLMEHTELAMDELANFRMAHSTAYPIVGELGRRYGVPLVPPEQIDGYYQQ